MKYLKTLNELFKSTYKSAADKLGNYHPKRKEELMKHATELGTNMPTSKPRLWPFRFTFKISQDGEFFSIIDVKPDYDGSRVNFEIILESNWGKQVKIPLVFYIQKEGNVLRYSYDFRFDNNDYREARLNAMELRKFFIDYLEGNVDLEPPANLLGASLEGFEVNNLFKS
jgi:hypothetical protein